MLNSDSFNIILPNDIHFIYLSFGMTSKISPYYHFSIKKYNIKYGISTALIGDGNHTIAVSKSTNTEESEYLHINYYFRGFSKIRKKLNIILEFLPAYIIYRCFNHYLAKKYNKFDLLDYYKIDKLEEYVEEYNNEIKK